MAVIDLFSKRMRRARGEAPDVYTYDLPKSLRVQVLHMLDEYGGENSSSPGFGGVARIAKQLRKEHGRVRLDDALEPGREYRQHHPWVEDLYNFVAYEADPELVVDAIELFCLLCAERGKVQVVAEINARLREAGVGFEFNGGQMIRKDSEVLHGAVVLPALVLLADKRLTAANDEYRRAHEHFRRGEYGDCLSECLKCFESTLKVVCTAKGWPYDAKKDTASKLIEIVIKNGLLPDSVLEQFTSLQAMLKSGIATPRNRHDGHGGGTTQHAVPEYLASFLIHQTAATILMIAEAAELA